MLITITAKIKLVPSQEQIDLLQQTVQTYCEGCNWVSSVVFDMDHVIQTSLHQLTYRTLRSAFGLRSQMAQSVMKTVMARYKSMRTSRQIRSKVVFKRPEYDLVWNRDYSLVQGKFSVNTLQGRVKVPFESKGMEKYFNGSWSFGTAKLVSNHGKWYLHIPMTKEIEPASEHDIRQVVGIDLGVNFLAVSYDSNGTTTFVKGRPAKDRRRHYQQLRKQLQQKRTKSARKRLKAIGSRENRLMSDVNHQLSKALVERYEPNTLFVVENLTGVRQATEKVRKKDRYSTVSWAFYQLRHMLEYKAAMKGAKVIAVDPKYTSQTCPKCNGKAQENRDKKKHVFHCTHCGYASNDDRIAAMNLERKGTEYLAQVTASV